MIRSIFLAFLLCVFVGSACAQSTRLALVLAKNSEDFHGQMWLFEKQPNGGWNKQVGPWPVLLGKKGVAWGRGLNGPMPGLQKAEGDEKSPAGRFQIGYVLGAAKGLPEGFPNWPYHQVTENDAWIDDSRLANYNRLVTVRGPNKPAWFEKQKMKPNDPAYKWRVLIEHNYPKGEPWKGSAIFFHLRRGLEVPSAGCVTMSEPDMLRFLSWLEPQTRPQVVILSWEEYMRLQKEWNLPVVSKGKN